MSYQPTHEELDKLWRLANRGTQQEFFGSLGSFAERVESAALARSNLVPRMREQRESAIRAAKSVINQPGGGWDYGELVDAVLESAALASAPQPSELAEARENGRGFCEAITRLEKERDEARGMADRVERANRRCTAQNAELVEALRGLTRYPAESKLWLQARELVDRIDAENTAPAGEKPALECKHGNKHYCGFCLGETGNGRVAAVEPPAPFVRRAAYGATSYAEPAPKCPALWSIVYVAGCHRDIPTQVMCYGDGGFYDMFGTFHPLDFEGTTWRRYPSEVGIPAEPRRPKVGDRVAVKFTWMVEPAHCAIVNKKAGGFFAEKAIGWYYDCEDADHGITWCFADEEPK